MAPAIFVERRTNGSDKTHCDASTARSVCSEKSGRENGLCQESGKLKGDHCTTSDPFTADENAVEAPALSDHRKNQYSDVIANDRLTQPRSVSG